VRVPFALPLLLANDLVSVKGETVSDNDPWFEETGSELHDSEYPDTDDYDDEISETVACADCGQDVYEDAVRCPYCGSYTYQGSHVWSGRPGWWIILGLLGIGATVLTLSGLFL